MTKLHTLPHLLQLALFFNAPIPFSKLDILAVEASGEGGAFIGLPMRKCPGVSVVSSTLVELS